MGKRNGGGRGGGGYNKGRGEDITSARGSGCVIATCNVAREREGSRELVTLLTQMIEKVYPDLEDDIKMDGDSSKEDEPVRELTAEELIRQEVEGLKSKTSTTQAVVSLQTGVKGVVFAKIRKRHICPLRLVHALFSQVEADGLPVSRHLVRIVPLQRVFFPDEQELITHVRAIVGLPPLDVKKIEKGDEAIGKEQVNNEDQGVETTERTTEGEQEEVSGSKRGRDEDSNESFETKKKVKQEEVVKEEPAGEDESVIDAAMVSSSNVGGQNVSVEGMVVAPPVVPGPALTYNFTIKIRNHDTLKKNQIISTVTRTLPRHRFHYSYKDFKGMFVVNIFKNIAGISIVEDYDSMIDFNIAKHQDKHSKSDVVV